MSRWKSNKKILFGISGGISAYKTPDILRGWIKAGCEVEVMLTEAAEAFVSPLVLSTLTGRRVWLERDFFSREEGWKIPHISLTDWADLLVVAPCTANVLKQCANGEAGTLLGATMLACTKPVLLFPAMNSKMLSHPSTQENIEKAKEHGCVVINPDEGPLACGYDGKGRLPSNEVINAHVWRLLYPHKDLLGKKVLVTAGPTHEYIDPVRYIGNPSSGKMGYEIAKNAWYRGAQVTLVSGPVSLAPSEGVRVVNVVSAEEMWAACIEEAAAADIIVKAAAVGDFKAAQESEHKIKRKKGEPLALELTQNPDIAADLGAAKRLGQILVGFAAETQNLLENAAKKMSEKKLDMIAVNDVLAKDAGFGTETNSITLISIDGEKNPFSGTKEEVAEFILDAVVKAAQK